ncbi:MAG: amidohydrolase family protein [Bradyrhizobiaceae bacterium]|nr:amidohydrolase family protein [Bradyrhizobiaceae bacterium]
MIPIIDAHHHIWRQVDLPWLQGPTVPRIFGPYDAIKRDYPIGEYLQDIMETSVAKSIYVQANWPKDRALSEVAWVQSVADTSGWPHGIVGFVDFLDEGAADLLAAQARYPLMRGVRQQLHWHENPLYRFAKPGVMNEPLFRRNLALLQDYGWPFELQIFSAQMGDGARLARDLPGITFVLQHAGMPEEWTPEGRKLWREGMRRLADLPNVRTKLSALGTFIHRVDLQYVAEVVAETIAIFGADRCIWGSNFPIEKLWATYREVLDAMMAALLPFSEHQRSLVLSVNAAKVYRLAS